MGFCQRCGEITFGKCKRCGGRSVESTISCLTADGGISIVDRWQSQYADTILAPEEIANKSPTSKRIPVTQSVFYDSPFVPASVKTKQLCTYCSKDLDKVSTRIIEDNSPYCKECHSKLFNKGICPSCRSPVTDADNFIEYVKKIWHTDCFSCFNCKTPLEANPLVDLEDRPCCEPCFMSQAGQRRASPIKSKLQDRTPVAKHFNSLSSEQSISASASSRSASSFQRSRLEQDLFQPKTPPLTRTPSPKEDPESDLPADLLSRRTRSPHRLSTMFIPPVASPPSVQKSKLEFKPSSSPIISSSNKTTDTEIQYSSLSQRPCHVCQLPLGDALQKKVKVPLGPSHYAWFHKACFVCSKCHEAFKDGECATDGQSFYHAQCDSLCSGCQKVIQQDSFQFNGKMYHFDCFRCFGAGCKLGLGQPIFEVNKKPYCESCHTTFIEPKQTVLSPPLSSSSPVGPKQTRQLPHRVLPKLGGSKTCPRCRKDISIMDDTPGPFASRWHKKCLACTKCSKQLDSAAKMKQGLQGESVVYCRNCIA